MRGWQLAVASVVLLGLYALQAGPGGVGTSRGGPPAQRSLGWRGAWLGEARGEKEELLSVSEEKLEVRRGEREGTVAWAESSGTRERSSLVAPQSYPSSGQSEGSEAHGATADVHPSPVDGRSSAAGPSAEGSRAADWRPTRTGGRERGRDKGRRREGQEGGGAVAAGRSRRGERGWRGAGNSMEATHVQLSSVPSERLVAELHRRRYGWDVLARARLGVANFTPAELLAHALAEVGREGYIDALRLSSLGLGIYSASELLLELRSRPDLADALSTTGTGSPTDFECPGKDAMPNVAGCQVRCGARLEGCSQARELCQQIKHCVRFEVNREGTVATLKSFQVYTPAPTPTCDGFVFSDNGGPPVPLATPRRVEFDVSVPREDWCFRDTGVSTTARAEWARRAPENGCTMERCFDPRWCLRPGASGSGSPALFFYPEPPPTKDMVRWPDCLRQCHRTSLVESVRQACVVVPTVNVNCEWDQCDPATHAKLRALPSWTSEGGGQGRNHLIWDYNDAQNLKYRTDEVRREPHPRTRAATWPRPLPTAMPCQSSPEGFFC